jgi:hopanoid biosynthesis associated protein HpnK
VSARRLIVSADDFGAAPEVNEAVERAHRHGVLTNASLMVSGGAVADAVAVARRLPQLGVGLHLVLVQGVPTAPRERIPRLVRSDGRFADAPVWSGFRYAWLFLLRAGARQLRAEIEAQLGAFARTGLVPSHVDGHLNMHLHPMVLPTLIELAPRYGVRAMRLPHEPLARAIRRDGRHVLRRSAEGAVFAALGRFAAPRLRAAGIVVPRLVYGLHQTGEVDARYLQALLSQLPGGTSEVYCHPAVSAPEVLTRHQRGYANARELEALVDPTVREAARVGGVELVSYHALAS